MSKLTVMSIAILMTTMASHPASAGILSKIVVGSAATACAKNATCSRKAESLVQKGISKCQGNYRCATTTRKVISKIGDVLIER